MPARFIAISVETYGGHFGVGETREEALRNLRKAGGKKRSNVRLNKFTSDLPFVPVDEKREATDTEADAWVDRYGGLNWIRCERDELDDLDASIRDHENYLKSID